MVTVTTMIFLCCSSKLVFQASWQKRDKFSKCLPDLLERPPVEYLHNLQRQQIFSQRKLAREYLIALPAQAVLFAATFDPVRLQSSTGQKFRR